MRRDLKPELCRVGPHCMENGLRSERLTELQAGAGRLTHTRPAHGLGAHAKLCRDLAPALASGPHRAGGAIVQWFRPGKSENNACIDSGRGCPIVYGSLDPIGKRHGPKAPSLSEDVHHTPPAISDLQVFKL